MATIFSVLKWTYLSLAGLVVLALVVFFGAGIVHNQFVRDEMREFCAGFRVGQTLNADEAAQRARDKGYQVKAISRQPAGEPPLQFIYVQKRSWSGTRWMCDLRFTEGRVAEAKFRGRGMVD